MRPRWDPVGFSVLITGAPIILALVERIEINTYWFEVEIIKRVLPMVGDLPINLLGLSTEKPLSLELF